MLGKTIATAFFALAALFAASLPAAAYSASQAEALSDPSHADPYTFPNVKPCCGAKPDPCANGKCRSVAPRPRPCWERPSGCRRAVRKPSRCYGDDCGDRPRRSVASLHVRCDGGGDVRTIQEAIDLVQDGDGTVYVYGGFPGGTCRESLRITGSVTLIGVGEGPMRQRPDLETPPGPCVVVAGSRARARIVDLNINAAAGPSCIEVNGGTLRLEGVNVNASASGAGVVVRSGWFTAAPTGSAQTWILAGGPAVMAQGSDVVIGGSVLQTAGAFSYTPFVAMVPPGGYAPNVPGYPPLRFFADLDAPYGGGAPPPSNPWPDPNAPAIPPAPAQPVNNWPQPAAPQTIYPQPAYAQPAYGQPVYATPAPGAYPAPVLNPAPAPFAGTPVLVLEESQGVIQNADIRGGTTGVAAIISSSRSGRDVRISNSRIVSQSGVTGILAVASGGWSGMPSRLVVDQNTQVSGFETGIDLSRVSVAMNALGIAAGTTGVQADEFANGTIYSPRVAAGRRCFRFGGDGFSGDRPGRLAVANSTCTE